MPAPTRQRSSPTDDWTELPLHIDLDTSGELAVDWDEIADLIDIAFRTVAPKTLVAEHDTR